MIRKRLAFVVIGLMLASALSAQQITPPDDFFGFRLGSDFKLAGWDQIVSYFKLLDSQSDRIQVEELGQSTQGNPFIMAIISSEENLRRVGEFRAIARRLAMARDVSQDELPELIKQGKSVVLITCSIHATEVGAAQASSELAYNLITEKDPRAQSILENVVFLLIPSFNPDGLIMVKNWYDKYLHTPMEASRMPWLYHFYTGHDNNRDAFMLTQVESRLVNRVMYKEWFPQVYLDMHQMGNRSARIFVPPFIDPLNPNIHPLVTKMNSLIGEYMATSLQARGKQGVVTGAIFTSWWQGGFLLTAWWHNMVGVLTELASVNIASPIFQTKVDLQGLGRGFPEYRIQVNFPDPWPGGWWRLRDIVDYDIEAAMSLLEFSAIYREKFLKNVYQMGRTEIEKGKTTPPYAYVVPANQRDPLATRKMLRILQLGGVEIHRARSDFKADGIQYSRGDYVILMAQPYRAYAKDMLEPQHYPDLRQVQGGPPIQPYDVSGWTLPYQMGVRAVEVVRPFQAELQFVEEMTLAEGTVPEKAGFGYLLDGKSTEVYAAVNDLLQAGLEIYRNRKPFTIKGKKYSPGCFIVRKKGKNVISTLRSVAEKRHVPFVAVDKKHNDWQRLQPLRLAVYEPWFPSMHEGWSRWVFDEYGFAYKILHNEEIRAGGLRDRYDVIYIPDIRAEGILKGREAGTVPPEYTRGIEAQGLEHLRQFVNDGGVIVAMDASTELFMDAFNLPVSNVVKGVKRTKFFCPGSILQIEVDPNHPVGFGMEEKSMAYFANSSVFKVFPSFEKKIDVVAKYPAENLLKSGYLLGEKTIARQSAVVDATVGKGHVILVGFDAVNRAQAQNTFKILFNAIYYAGLK